MLILFALFCEAPVASSVALRVVTDERETVELSLVIPVYNGSRTKRRRGRLALILQNLSKEKAAVTFGPPLGKRSILPEQEF